MRLTQYVTRSPLSARLLGFSLILCAAVIAAGCQLEPAPDGRGIIDLEGDYDGGPGLSGDPLSSGAASPPCPLSDPEECMGWEALRAAYARLYDVPLPQAAPERWLTGARLSASRFELGRDYRGDMPDGPFTMRLMDVATDVTDDMRAELDAEGRSTAELDRFGLRAYAANVLLITSHGTVAMRGVLLSADNAIPGSDPAFPTRFLAGFVDPLSLLSGGGSSCSPDPSSYACGPVTPPACDPSCSDSPISGHIMDTMCWSTESGNVCRSYQTNMANACRTFGTALRNCLNDFKAQIAVASGIYAATLVGCTVVGIFTLGIGTAACAGGAMLAYSTALAGFLAARNTCEGNAASSLGTEQSNARATRDTDFANARDVCCTTPCPTPPPVEVPPREPEDR